MLLNKKTSLDEGELMCKWLNRRLLVQNKNILGANLGPTGSGKSYRDLRLAEIWYEKYLKRTFPPENICFGTLQTLKRLKSGEIGKGDLLIYEEAGANMGNLDFQNRTSKMFSYVLQSFRSMNVGILFNLPYLSMLNKSARMLLHYSMISQGIDPVLKKNHCKLFFHQVNQSTGKIYTKHPRVSINGKVVCIDNMSFGMPSEALVKEYERRKAEYLSNMQSGFLNEMEKQEDKANGIYPLTQKQQMVYELLLKGHSQAEIVKITGIKQQNVSVIVNKILEKGWKLTKNMEIEGGVQQKHYVVEPTPLIN